MSRHRDRLQQLLVTETENTLVQLFRYTFVGGVAFIVDFGLLLVLTETGGINYLVSAAIAFTAGLTINYLLSIQWVFASRTLANRRAEFSIFAFIGIVGLGLNELFLWIFTDGAGWHYLASKIVATAIVFFWNFLARRFILFRKREVMTHEEP